MSTSMAPHKRGWSRRRRYAAVFLPSIAVGLGWSVLTAQGALAASLHVSGLPTTITADRLVGTNFAQYGWFDGAKANPGAGIPGLIPVTRTGIENATLYNLCQSVTIPGFNVSLVIKAGTDSANPVKATNLVIDMSKLEGNATFTNIDIGGDASELSKGPKGFAGPQNMFSQEAQALEITKLKQTAYSTSAGTFTLNGLSLEVKTGTITCPV
ncbi:MAG TPA: DUF6230 family protein [Kineosporiaceae bacterium]